MTYHVKSIFYTLQGEGARVGRPAVFCRFTGCNLWSGRKRDQAHAQCHFCDTDFVGTDGAGGGQFANAQQLSNTLYAQWPPATCAKPYVVLTGGEPLLQLDTDLIAALHDVGFETAIETNGTLELPPGIDWICVSPKAGTTLKVKQGHELKLVYPQPGAPPEQFADLAFDYFYLQPMDNAARERNTQQALQYCLTHPQWRLSLQVHKWLNIP